MNTNKEYIYQIVASEITESRMAHSVRVAELSKLLAGCHGYADTDKAYIVGLLHDITKQKPIHFHTQIFRQNNFEYKDIPENSYHAFSGAFYCMTKYHITDPEVLSAIANHTLGGSQLLLDQILYVADFLGSNYAISQPAYTEWLEKTKVNLSYGLLIKSKTVILELLEKEHAIHPTTLDVYNSNCSA
jgi:predicted HD superfamily hydrolase involved in NAD metabolism